MKKSKYEYQDYWSEEVREMHKMKVWSDINLVLAIIALVASIVMPIIRL